METARRISVRFAEAAALPCIHRMCRRVWDSKSGKVRLGAQVRHREGALGGLWGASWGSWGASWGALGGSWGFLEDLLLSWLRFGGSWWASWGLKGAKIKSFGNSGCQLEPVLAPKEPPRGGGQIPQDEPKRPPKASSRAFLSSKSGFIKKCGFSVVK